MKNKGFTLVELLAMLVVLGILIAIAVPNISGMIEAHKINQFISDVEKMENLAKTKVLKDDSIKKPTGNDCIIFSLKSLNHNEDISKGPNDKPYHEYASFVVYKREANEYKYYVTLIEKEVNKGVSLANVNKVQNGNVKIQNMTPVNITDTSTADTQILKNATSGKCSNIEQYYKS